MEIADLVSRVQTYLTPADIDLVRRAYAFALTAHDGQTRRSGEPFFEHPYQTTWELAGLQADAPTLAAALLHDVVEDSAHTLEEIRGQFGEDVARMVDGVTKLTQVEMTVNRDGRLVTDPKAAIQVESLRKMLVAMARDIRVVLIKLADRLHNMRTLAAMPEDARKRISKETLDIYAPLAHRLGIAEFSWQLEDMAFRYLEPEEYARISRLLDARREARESYITQVTDVLKTELQKSGIKAEVSGRAKHIYSIYQKMQRYETMGRAFGDIYDLLAVRIIVDTVPECYHAVGVVHALWRPLPGQFDDYIASPRDNLYQSIHTTVRALENKPMEIQIRTNEMHRVAEYGVAAHWRYKEGGSSSDMRFEERVSWLRQLLEWQREVSGAEEFVESVKSDIFPDQVFVYTPKGDIKELPAGATPLDFAFYVHTDLGYQCSGAKVNGRLVALTYQLRNGDTVEIIPSKKGRAPSLDWLNPELGYVRTATARSKIRYWFHRQQREENIQRGRQALEREAKRLSATLDPQELASKFKFSTGDDFLAAIGSGTLSIPQVTARLMPAEERPTIPTVEKSTVGGSAEVRVLGVGDVATRMARCCEPIPGDDIVGFITRGRGVTVHRADCPSIASEDEPERLVPVTWVGAPSRQPVEAVIQGTDRVGLLRDLTTVVASENVNITAVSDRHWKDGSVTIFLTLETTGLGQLSRLFSKLEGVRGVISASRAVNHTGARSA